MCQVTVLSLADGVGTSRAVCADGLSPATEVTKYYLTSYIAELTIADSRANHTLGVGAALSTIPNGELIR